MSVRLCVHMYVRTCVQTYIRSQIVPLISTKFGMYIDVDE